MHCKLMSRSCTSPHNSIQISGGEIKSRGLLLLFLKISDSVSLVISNSRFIARNILINFMSHLEKILVERVLFPVIQIPPLSTLK